MKMITSDLTISISGPMTEDNIDLNKLGITLINIQAMFDRTYCYYFGHKKMSSLDRDGFKLVANDVKRGSILFNAGVSLFAVQQTLPLITAITVDPDFIIKATFTAFKFLIDVLTKTKNNECPTININNSPNCHILYNSNGNTVEVSHDINQIAQEIRYPTRKIANTFKPGITGAIQISSPNNPNSPITIDNNNYGLFHSDVIKSDVPISLRGIVKSYSADTLSGQFQVLPNMSIPEGKYPFTIERKSKDVDAPFFIESLKGEPVSVSAKIDYSVFSNAPTEIIRLHLSPSGIH